jgi:hypothetical protein
MKNILKVWLRKNLLAADPAEYNAQIAVRGNMDLDEIVDELIKDGLELNREAAINLISSFNRKSADLVLTGYNVNTGLVKMRSSVREPLMNGKWDPNTNWVNVTLTHGKDLYQAVADTTVEIAGEREVILETYHLSDQPVQFTGNTPGKVKNADIYEPRLKIAGEPACGMAFRNWLCKA